MSSADPAFLLFDTDFNYQKIATEGSQSVDVVGAVASYTLLTVDTGLDYVPAARVYIEKAGTRTDDLVFGTANSYQCWFENNDLVISKTGGIDDETVTFLWRIYYDGIAD